MFENNKVMEFLRIVFCCPVIEGYGQTENAAAAFITHTSDASIGHVGNPVANNEVVLYKCLSIIRISLVIRIIDFNNKIHKLGFILL